jgi:cellulose synthase/poly-beta-1,6-N-acetylglucosamine synthase-like glycosyltransferase
MWIRVQRAEFAKWTDTALRRKGQWTSVLAGTACAISAEGLERVVDARVLREEEPYPWSYQSDVEDFELSYRLRELSFYCKVSPTVRAYTGAMLSFRTLWAQRMKWQGGTCADLLRFGPNRLTAVDWWQQFLGLFAAFSRVLWVSLLLAQVVLLHHLHLMAFWWAFPMAFAAFDLRESIRVPHRTWQGVVTAAALLPQELFAWMRAGWFVVSWAQVLTGRTKDRWSLQIAAETGQRP